MNKWQRKLLAYLHDPPHKALDIPGHEQATEVFLRQAGFTDAEQWKWFDKQADRSASAADRFPLFHSSLQSPFGGDHPFKHPLGGSELTVKEFPSPDLLMKWLQVTQPHGEGILDAFQGEDRDRVNFFLHWRRWPVEAAREPAGGSEARWRSAYQPADTRLPDHPIWLHNSVVSALEGAGSQPAFLLFQIGPVQDFIAQARSTRDLWSGSYLLSWLMAHAIKAVTDQVGPDAVIFPFLRAQPLFDLLHRDEIYKRITYQGDSLWDRMNVRTEDILVPNLPNKFLALVPAAKGASLADAADKALRKELDSIAKASWAWIDKRHRMQPDWRKRFDDQVESFPQITWQVFPWPDFQELEKHRPAGSSDWNPVDYLLSEFAEFGGKPAEDLKKIRELGSTYPWNAGFVWPYLYAQTDRLHAARRNTRDFAAWMPNDAKKAGTPKDSFSGKEEIVGDENWWKTLPKTGEFARLFRSQDKLGAINLVKKVWHFAYLRDEKGLIKGAASFESVPDVAAGKWLSDFCARSLQALKESPDAFERLVSVCELIQKHAEAWNISTPGEVSERNVDEWLANVSPEAFLESEWKRANEEQSEVRAALRQLYSDKKVGIGKPPMYVAILAFDGDEMGKWISGEKTPPLIEQFSKEACEEFGERMMGVNRPLSPSYHLQFSEALANFAIYLVRPIVEHFGGQLIYAGGDDVLAMVPAALALECAAALRDAFRGQGRRDGVYESCGSKGGFVRLVQPKGEQPTGPLIVPGPCADVSAGIAIGHCHSPLQNLVEAARKAEGLAKKEYRRAAFAVSLFKRSGETIQWGAKWDSQALKLMKETRRLTDEGRLTGRFPYALAELLRPYAQGDWQIEKTEAFDPFEIFPKELEHVAGRQGRWPKGTQAAKEDFLRVAAAYLGVAANGSDMTCRRRRLDDFLGPFLTHAFMSRRGGE